mgnify:FL=1
MSRVREGELDAGLPGEGAQPQWSCDKHGREFVKEYCKRCSDDTAASVLAEILAEEAAVPDERAAKTLVVVLIACEAKLRSLASEFMGNRFTDRHGDGPVMLELANRARAALAQPETPPRVAQCGAHAYRPDADGQCQGCGGMGAESHWGHQTTQPETPPQ